jgi:hypothetical protein
MDAKDVLIQPIMTVLAVMLTIQALIIILFTGHSLVKQLVLMVSMLRVSNAYYAVQIV